MDNYIALAGRTESLNVPHMTKGGARLLHAAVGMVTEAGEFIDALKKSMFYGKPLDYVNLREELGDILWYMAIAMDQLETTFEIEMERNIAKLRTRYPDKFTSENAITRDLDAERTTLEGSSFFGEGFASI